MYVYASDCGHRIAIILHDVPTRPDLSTVSAFSIRDQDCPTCGSHLYPFGEHYIGEVLVADANSLRNVIADDASSAARDSLAVGCPGYTACASSNASRHTCDAVIAVLNCLQLVELSSDERLCTNLITPTPVPYDAAAVVAERFEQQKNDAAASFESDKPTRRGWESFNPGFGKREIHVAPVNFDEQKPVAWSSKNSEDRQDEVRLGSNPRLRSLQSRRSRRDAYAMKCGSLNDIFGDLGIGSRYGKDSDVEMTVERDEVVRGGVDVRETRAAKAEAAQEAFDVDEQERPLQWD